MTLSTHIKLRFILTSITALTFCSLAQAENILTMNAGKLSISINSKGQISALTDSANNHNYIMQRCLTGLISIQEWNGKVNPQKEPMLSPVSAKLLKNDNNSALIELNYNNGAVLQATIEAKKEYFRMELVQAKPLDNINKITWGPYFTTMREPIGKHIGITRSKNFSIGLISLEMNTDGEGWANTSGAIYERGGSRLIQVSYDRTKPRALRRSFPHAVSTPEDVTIIGSAVALFGTKRGYDNELNIIEKIELAENLPHPIYRGVWAKRS
jgi:hypothetical protein